MQGAGRAILRAGGCNNGVAWAGACCCDRRAYKVLSFGDCTHGALGNGRGCLGGDSYEPEPVQGLPEDVASIAAGHYHSLAITAGGRLWSWGRNVECQLGRSDAESREHWSCPQEVQGLHSVKVKAAAGSGVVSMAIDDNGRVWAWGKSKRGQLGLGEKVIESQVPKPIQVLAAQCVIQVSLGWGHALACTADGSLFSWGYPADGRLGYPLGPSTSHRCLSKSFVEDDLLEATNKSVEEDMQRESELALQWEPRLVDLGGVRVTEVACGFDHSLVLCENGHLLSFGDDTYGQLGRMGGSDFVEANKVELRDPVASMSAGLGHSLAIIARGNTGQSLGQCGGTAYSWGWNSAFQLGRPACSSKPTKIEGQLDNRVVRLDGGRVHSIAVTSNGELWTWGSGKNGRLGLGSFADSKEPCLIESIEDFSVQQAMCGMDHTLLLVQEKGSDLIL